jgi:putative addiction module component (TIGR02574 family)
LSGDVQFVRIGDYTGVMSLPSLDIATLTPEERLDLLEQLWDSLTATPEAIPLTDAQRAELDRRLDDLDREGPTGMSWDDALSGRRDRDGVQSES